MDFPFQQYIKEGKMVRVMPNNFQFQNLFGTEILEEKEI